MGQTFHLSFSPKTVLATSYGISFQRTLKNFFLHTFTPSENLEEPYCRVLCSRPHGHHQDCLVHVVVIKASKLLSTVPICSIDLFVVYLVKAGAWLLFNLSSGTPPTIPDLERSPFHCSVRLPRGCPSRNGCSS